MQPKKFGDCTTTAAVLSSIAVESARRCLPGRLVKRRVLPVRYPRAARKCARLSRYSGWIADDAITFERLVTRSAIKTASAIAVEPSYIDAFAMSMPVNWQTSV